MARGVFERAGSVSVIALALSCSAVLGLDEPTLRSDSGTQGASGASNGGSAGSPVAGAGGAGGVVGSTGGDLGSSGSNGPGGAIVTAGSSGAGGAGGSTAGGAPDGGGAGSAKDAGMEAGRTGCQGLNLPLCDDFEQTATGALPDMSKWVMQSQNPTAMMIAVDGAHSYSGMKSVRVQASDPLMPIMITNKASLDPAQIWYFRFRALLTEPLVTGGFLAFRELNNPMRWLLLGLRNGSLAYFFAQPVIGNQTLLPSGSSQLMTSYRPSANAWFCVEMMINPQGFLQTWINGIENTVLRADSTPTMGVDDIWTPFYATGTVGFGWWPGSANSPTVYLDDLAASYSRIGGCN
jgi:hypothetical protein